MEYSQVQRIKTKFHIHIQTCAAYIGEMMKYISNTELNILYELKDTNRYTFRVNTLVSNKTLNIINDFININNLDIDLGNLELFRKYRLITLIFDYLDKTYDINDNKKIIYSHYLSVLIITIIPFWSEYCCADKCECDWENEDVIHLCPEYCALSVDDHILIWHMNDMISLLNNIINNVSNENIKQQNMFNNIIIDNLDVFINSLKTKFQHN